MMVAEKQRSKRGYRNFFITIFCLWLLYRNRPRGHIHYNGERFRSYPPLDLPTEAPEHVDATDGSCQTFRKHYPDENPSTPIRRKRYALLTYAVGQNKSQHVCKARANHCAWAASQPDTDCIDNRNLQKCMNGMAEQNLHLIEPAEWGKISVLQSCCQYYEYVLMVAKDVLFMDGKMHSMRNFIDNSKKMNKDIIMPAIKLGMFQFSNGLLGIRCSNGPGTLSGRNEGRVGVSFLNEIMKMSRNEVWRRHRLSDLRAMLKVYEEHSHYLESTFLVTPERELQCYVRRHTCSRNDFTIHFLGAPDKYEMHFVRYFCNSKVTSKAVEEIKQRVCSSDQ